MTHRITSTFDYNIIYVYTIPDEVHRGRVKIGETTAKLNHIDVLSPDKRQTEIENAAKKRIDQQTKTADVEYELLHAELAVTDNNEVFSDGKVHDILLRSGYSKKSVRKGANEWFEISLETAQDAIQAAKEGRNCLGTAKQMRSETDEFRFRESQLDAIKQTIKYFKNKDSGRYLWNAKMRFGKTTAAMQVAKERGFKKTLIITHRPAVEDSWFDDFRKLFPGKSFQYGSKKKGEMLGQLLVCGKPFMYFASIQDLRGSKEVVKDSESQAEGFDKNNKIFQTHWDFLIVDEAHEGTQSALGKVLDEKIQRDFTLFLSGTPFNLLDQHEADEVYTWDYVMEQEAKENWEQNHPGEPNPYAELPKLSMFTFELNKYIEQPDFVNIEDKAFNFKEFFRVDENTEKFVHESFVKKFLNLISKESETQFPYSTEKYRNSIKHSLWMLPGVKEAKVLSELLRKHPVFSAFGIVNVAGKEDNTDPLSAVRKAIKNNDYTITLTCRKLTTGVNVPQWTAVLYLSNTTSATTYLQTVFRSQTPCSIDGKRKTQCYVFDFAPDRTLQIIAEAAELRAKAGETNTDEQKEYMGKFLNFCPIISATQGAMKPFDVGAMLRELKRAAIQRVVRNGFDDPKVYNDQLLRLNDVDLDDFNTLQRIIGSSQQTQATTTLTVNALGFDEEQFERARTAEKKPKRERTPEEEELIRRRKVLLEQRQKMVSILRGVSIRIPMLMFGIDLQLVDKDDTPVSIEDFIKSVDEDSWQEFMPKGVTKELFQKFVKYYDKEVFEGAGLNIRRKVMAADKLLPLERIETIAGIFAAFKNPDKETVLTPWQTVNKHISGTLGGSNFNEKDETGLPAFSSGTNGADSAAVWDNPALRVLEINSKSGLYPLLAAYNLYATALKRRLVPRYPFGTFVGLGAKPRKSENDVYQDLWRKILLDNIFVLCKTPMAAAITRRTLAGFTGVKVHTAVIVDLTKKFDKPDDDFAKELTKRFNPSNPSQKMQFDVIIGNPPYQQNDGGGTGSSAVPLYHKFVQQAKKLNPQYISMIMPSRWFSGGRGLDVFRDEMLNDKRIRVLHDYPNADDVFPGISIEGGVCYFLWSRDNEGLCKVISHTGENVTESERTLLEKGGDTFIRYNEAISILQKVQKFNEGNFADIVSANDPFGFDVRQENSYKRIKPKFKKKPFKDSVTFYYYGWQEEGIGYIDKSQIRRNKEWVDCHKVFISKAYGMGTLPTQVINEPLYAPQGTCSTETYLLIGPFRSENESRNVISYIKTRFFRFLVLLIKNTQNAMKKVYSFVPLQDFSESWTDAKLYAKYGLTAAETAFIESMIRDME